MNLRFFSYLLLKFFSNFPPPQLSIVQMNWRETFSLRFITERSEGNSLYFSEKGKLKIKVFPSAKFLCRS